MEIMSVLANISTYANARCFKVLSPDCTAGWGLNLNMRLSQSAHMLQHFEFSILTSSTILELYGNNNFRFSSYDICIYFF